MFFQAKKKKEYVPWKKEGIWSPRQSRAQLKLGFFEEGSRGVSLFFCPDMQTLRTVFAVFGKGCLAASFNCVFLYTGELYPTVIR